MKYSPISLSFQRNYGRLFAASSLCMALLAGYYKTKTIPKAQEKQHTLAHYYVDFNSSLQIDTYKAVAQSHWGPPLLHFFRTLYEKANFTHVMPETFYKIPTLIHQIWLGSPFPEKYKFFQESWKKHHPGWEYKLWTDQDIKKLKLENQELYNKASNYGEKSDIARYEILYRYGGVYVDTDFECLKSLQDLHKCYDFYIGIQPLDTNIVQLGIGIIGVKPGHGLLKKAIEDLRSTTHIPQIIAKTGPLFFTKIFYDYSSSIPGVTIALPPSYFYPCGYTQDSNKPELWRKPESFAIHHWQGSWLKPEAFEKKSE